MRNKLLLLSVILFISKNMFGTDCQNAFEAGEKLKYSIVYQIGFLWVPAGEFTTHVTEGKFGSNPVFYFNMQSESLKSYEWFYTFNSQIYSYANRTTFQPYHGGNNTDRNGSKSSEINTVDYLNRKVFYSVNKNNIEKRTDTLNLTKDLFDIPSAAYYLRSIDFSKKKTNDKIIINIICDGTFYPITIKFLGKEIMELSSKRKISSLKLSVSLIAGDIFDKGEELLVWITDDVSHLPVKFETKVLAGLVKAEIIETKNTKTSQLVLRK